LIRAHFKQQETETRHATGGLKKMSYKTGGNIATSSKVDKSISGKFDDIITAMQDRISCLPGICHSCNETCETRMVITDLPYFKEVILMCTECSHCGFKDSEVKPGGGISETGRRIELKISELKDLQRDVLKSDSASVSIPELEFESMHGTLGGKYTTVEGILKDTIDQLRTANPFALGDSASSGSQYNKLEEFFVKWDKTISETGWTFVIDDPLGNSYVETYGDDDKSLTVTEYERTDEMNDDLGISDIKTEGYEQDDQDNEQDDQNDEQDENDEQDDHNDEQDGQATHEDDTNDSNIAEADRTAVQTDEKSPDPEQETHSHARVREKRPSDHVLHGHAPENVLDGHPHGHLHVISVPRKIFEIYHC